MGSLRIFGYILCAQKVPPPEEEHADSITNPPEKTHSLRKRVGSECYLQIIAAEIRVGLAAHGDIALTAAQHDDRRAGQAVVI